ncbi:MAG TPA: disulfide bond formation protein B [Hyphomicrobium sp.]|nr:disulfide bond formation protein B [Hyphomicrobium sp.]
MAIELPAGRSTAYQAGSIALFLAAAAILGAWGFEYAGYPPCHLCLIQRWAYYAGIPVLFTALALISGGNPRGAAWLFALTALAFLANSGLGVYQAGAEWKFWPGPDTCAGTQAMATSAGDLLKQLETTTVIRCDEAALRIFGLSLAGWNVIVSFVIFAATLRAAMAATEPH